MGSPLSEPLASGPRARDLPRLLALLAQEGERPALTFYRGKRLEGRLTYMELAAQVTALASKLRQQAALRAGDRVAILSPNRLEIPVLVLALLSLGAVVVPLNPASAAEDWTYILQHSGARGLFATAELAARVAPGSHPGFTLLIEDALRGNGGVSPAPAPAATADLSEEIAVVLYTSGTTGNPKGVALRQRNLLANAWSMARNFQLDRTTQLAVLPLYHAHAFGFGLMTALSTGGHLVFSERLEPFAWGEIIRRESVQVSSVVPTLLPLLLAAGVTQEKVPTLRHLLVSSAPLPPDLARAFEAKTQLRLVQGWGLSEYTNFACCVPTTLGQEEHQRLMSGWEVPSIGPALEGTEVRVALADASFATGAGERGELCVRGHSTMRGYLGDGEATARTLDQDGWLHTGDEGFFELEGGRAIFFVTGRLKEIIIRDAEKYSPLRLERRLVEALPELSGRLVVLGFPHRDHGEEIGAYLEMEALDEALRARLEAALESMPIAERPKVVLHGAQAIPRTHTGKVQRRRIQPLFAAYATHRGLGVIAQAVTP